MLQPTDLKMTLESCTVYSSVVVFVVVVVVVVVDVVVVVVGLMSLT